MLLGSVVRNLRLCWPEAHIAVLAESAYAGVLALNPDVDTTLTFPRSLGAWFGFLRGLRRARFTHVLDFDNTDKTALVTRITGAGVRATYDRESNPFRHRHVYTHAAPLTHAFYVSHHITETYLALAAAIGVPIVTQDLRLVPSADDWERARQAIPANGRKLLIHPGSRSEYRIWPADRFAAVADRLRSECHVQVFLTAGPREQPLVDAIRAHARTEIRVLAAPATASALAALLAQFDAFLCHDSGPMHVAAAVGTPVIALFGSQYAVIWRPLGPTHRVLQTALPCACIGAAAPTPCVRDDSYRSYCVRMLDPDTVFAAVAARFA